MNTPASDASVVHIGKDDYLFLEGGAHGVFSYFTAQRDPPSEAPGHLAANLKARQDYCDRTGRLFRMVVFPEKCVALADKIHGKGAIQSLYERCYKETLAPVCAQLCYPLDALSAQPGAFRRTDTHYGVRGDLAVTQDITKDIFPDLQDQFAQTTYPLVVPVNGLSGDLGRKFTPNRTETTDQMRGSAVQRTVAGNGMQGGNNGILLMTEAPQSLTDKTLLIFGDSFFRQILPHLSIFYRRIIFCRTRFFHYEMVDAFQPDHIFCGVAERYLSDVQPDADRPHFLSYPLVLGRPLQPDENFPALWQKFVDTSALTHTPKKAEAASLRIEQHFIEKGPNHMNLNKLDVNQTIDEKDGMFKNMREYYFVTGRSAMVAIKKTMEVAGRDPESITRVLDYACGFGRVLRWLMAAFPQAKVIGVDMDARAVASAQRTLDADTRVLDITLKKPLDKPVDLIWVGSLLTHLDEAECLRVLKYLCEHMLPGGLATITTHGTLIEERLRNREQVYNLTETGVTELLRSYDKTGYGFAAYKDEGDYGISLVSEKKMTKMIKAAGFKVLYFEPRGWVKHQDVFGIQRVK